MKTSKVLSSTPSGDLRYWERREHLSWEKCCPSSNARAYIDILQETKGQLKAIVSPIRPGIENISRWNKKKKTVTYNFDSSSLYQFIVTQMSNALYPIKTQSERGKNVGPLHITVKLDNQIDSNTWRFKSIRPNMTKKKTDLIQSKKNTDYFLYTLRD